MEYLLVAIAVVLVLKTVVKLPLSYHIAYLMADFVAMTLSVVTRNKWYTTDERSGKNGKATYKIFLAKGERKQQNIKCTFFRLTTAYSA